MDKQKRILVVGAGVAQINSINTLMRLGYFVIAVDGDEDAPGLESANQFKVCDIRNYKELIKVAESYKANAITSFCTDVPIVSIAKACEHLNLKGLNSEFAELFINKKFQRLLMKKNDISVPKFSTFESIKELKLILKDFNSAIVIKPVDSSGSKGVKYFDDISLVDFDYLKEVLTLSVSGQGIIETFIKGEEIAVDGFVIDGACRILSICSKLRTTPPYLLDTELRFPSNLSEEQITKVINLTEKIVSVSKMNDSPFHIEMINSKEGPLLVELAARGAGFNVFDKIIPHVSGVDTVSIQTSLALGNRPIIKDTERNAAILHFISSNTEGIVERISNKDSLLSIHGVEEVKFYVESGDKVYPLKSGQDRLGYILCLSDNLKECETALKQAKRKLILELKNETRLEKRNSQ